MAEIRLGPAPQIGASEVRASLKPRGMSGGTASADGNDGQGAIAASQAFAAGSAPVDADRVATIRRAIADGSYPFVPARTGDAMIAAGILLRSPKA